MIYSYEVERMLTEKNNNTHDVYGRRKNSDGAYYNKLSKSIASKHPMMKKPSVNYLVFLYFFR